MLSAYDCPTDFILIDGLSGIETKSDYLDVRERGGSVSPSSFIRVCLMPTISNVYK